MVLSSVDRSFIVLLVRGFVFSRGTPARSAHVHAAVLQPWLMMACTGASSLTSDVASAPTNKQHLRVKPLQRVACEHARVWPCCSCG